MRRILDFLSFIAQRKERECPFCAEPILARARFCKHCRQYVEPLHEATPKASTENNRRTHQHAAQGNSDNAWLSVGASAVTIAVMLIFTWHVICSLAAEKMVLSAVSRYSNSQRIQGEGSISITVDINGLSNAVVIRPDISPADEASGRYDRFLASLRDYAAQIVFWDLAAKAREDLDLYAMAFPYHLVMSAPSLSTGVSDNGPGQLELWSEVDGADLATLDATQLADMPLDKLPQPTVETPAPDVPPQGVVIKKPLRVEPPPPEALVHTTPAAIEATPAVVTAPEIEKKFVRRFQPDYPPTSRRLGEEGSVVLQVLVGTDGKVQDGKVQTSSGFPRLDEAALTHALRAWRFTPGTEDGKPVTTWHVVKVTFSIYDQ